MIKKYQLLKKKQIEISHNSNRTFPPCTFGGLNCSPSSPSHPQLRVYLWNWGETGGVQSETELDSQRESQSLCISAIFSCEYCKSCSMLRRGVWVVREWQKWNGEHWVEILRVGALFCKHSVVVLLLFAVWIHARRMSLTSVTVFWWDRWSGWNLGCPKVVRLFFC